MQFVIFVCNTAWPLEPEKRIQIKTLITKKSERIPHSPKMET